MAKDANGTNGTNGHVKAESKVELKACNTQSARDGVADCCADGLLEASAPLGKLEEAKTSAAPKNFEEFIYKVWGSGIAKHFAIPYNRKLWAVPLNEMETSWLGGRVPLPNLEEMIDGALKPTPRPMGPNARFGYPREGGFAALMEGFRPHLKGRVKTGVAITKVIPSRHLVEMSDGTVARYKSMVSTMPLPKLIKQMEDVPAPVLAAVAKLRHISVRCVHLGIGRENLTEKHWIYYPEDTIFHRIFVQGNASPQCNPAGGFGLTCEITYSDRYKPLPYEGNQLIQRCIEDCIRVGMFNAEDAVLAAEECDMPYAYVIYDHDRKAAVDEIRVWLRSHDIHLAGRYSEWEYYNSDHAFIAGRNAAEAVIQGEVVQESLSVSGLQIAQTSSKRAN